MQMVIGKQGNNDRAKPPAPSVMLFTLGTD